MRDPEDIALQDLDDLTPEELRERAAHFFVDPKTAPPELLAWAEERAREAIAEHKEATSLPRR